MLRFCVILIAVALLGISCNGSATDWEDLLAGVSEEDVALMPLPPDQLGKEYQALPLDDDAGPLSSTQVADDTFDPDDTADDIEANGWVGGYDLFLVDETVQSLEQADGPFSAGSVVMHFDGSDSALALLEQENSDTETLIGQDIGGPVLAASSNSEIKGLGDKAYAYKVTLEFADEGLTAFLTAVQVQLGNFVATTTIARGDQRDVAEEVEDLARALVDRIELIALGELDETPVPIASG